MRFGAAFWINRTTWPDLLAACRAVEAAGWDSLWIDDHLLADEGDSRDGKLEGWTTLAALAVLTERVRLGLLVGANTFRNPGLTAKLATTLDQLSNGRVVLGLGGGWFEREHDAFGIDFGSGFGERLDRLDEAVGLIRRLLDGETVTHDGRFYTMRDAVCEPRPIQARLPILIGGSGPTKTLRTTARYADLWNAYGTPERIAATSEILAQRCAEVGRPFDEIERTVTIHAIIRDTQAEADAAWAEVARRAWPGGSRRLGRRRAGPRDRRAAGGARGLLRRLPPQRRRRGHHRVPLTVRPRVDRAHRRGPGRPRMKLAETAGSMQTLLRCAVAGHADAVPSRRHGDGVTGLVPAA